jgi:hypothetical protein
MRAGRPAANCRASRYHARSAFAQGAGWRHPASDDPVDEDRKADTDEDTERQGPDGARGHARDRLARVADLLDVNAGREILGHSGSIIRLTAVAASRADAPPAQPGNSEASRSRMSVGLEDVLEVACEARMLSLTLGAELELQVLERLRARKPASQGDDAAHITRTGTPHTLGQGFEPGHFRRLVRARD